MGPSYLYPSQPAGQQDHLQLAASGQQQVLNSINHHVVQLLNPYIAPPNNSVRYIPPQSHEQILTRQQPHREQAGQNLQSAYLLPPSQGKSS